MIDKSSAERLTPKPFEKQSDLERNITMTEAILQTDFPEMKLLARGKVRDIYDLDDALLLVATDRLSAFDVVLPDPIPDKGKVLNQISLFWFDAMKELVPNHILATDVADFPLFFEHFENFMLKSLTQIFEDKPWCHFEPAVF
jgi:hypothetical protein